MSEEPPKTEGTGLGEIATVHAVSAAIITVFFRWQGAQHSFWQAGDEALLANGLSGAFDILYWLFKPRILRWRKG